MAAEAHGVCVRGQEARGRRVEPEARGESRRTSFGHYQWEQRGCGFGEIVMDLFHCSVRANMVISWRLLKTLSLLLRAPAGTAVTLLSSLVRLGSRASDTATQALLALSTTPVMTLVARLGAGRLVFFPVDERRLVLVGETGKDILEMQARLD